MDYYKKRELIIDELENAQEQRIVDALLKELEEVEEEIVAQEELEFKRRQ